MNLNNLTFEITSKPVINVNDMSQDSYSDALLKAKSALTERMHNILDYYCEQISLLDRFSSQAADKTPDEFWQELTNYTLIHFENREKIFEKVTGKNNFNCYAMLADYDELTIPWPDGYKEPGQRINGMAPLGLSSNNFFFAECGIVYRLDFGSCDHKETPIEAGKSGEQFNKLLEDVAIENINRLNKHPMAAPFRKALSKLIRAKHGNKPDNSMDIMEILELFSTLFSTMPDMHQFSIRILNEIDDTTTNFPQRFSIYSADEPISLEKFIDILNKV